MSDPVLSVVLCTYNRASIVGRAVKAVLDQAGDTCELVIVDDGSTDDTASVLAAIDDDRTRVVSRTNGGLTRARNSGLEVARGQWVVFLDDDDVPESGWYDALTSHAGDPDVGLVSVGVRFVDETGRTTGALDPRDLGPLFQNIEAVPLAGAFAARTDVVRAAGGYTEGLDASHQTELFIRLATLLRERTLRAVAHHRPLLVVERRDAADRPLSHPRRYYDGGRWVLARHPVAFAASRSDRAGFESVVGVNAARLDLWQPARRHLARAARVDPLDPRRWGRVALASVPALGRRVWRRQGIDASGAPRGIPRQTGVDGSAEPELFLPWRYEQNPPASADADGTPFWDKGVESSDLRYQDPVYRLAARLVRRGGLAPVLDIGCGTGHKLVERVGPATRDIIGVDQPSAIDIAERTFPHHTWRRGDFGDPGFWDELATLQPGLVLCVDVIEHLADPIALLHSLRTLAGSGAKVLISTPDRAVLETGTPEGPPANHRHIREWSADEIELLFESTGFSVDERWHLLPRRYSRTRTELNRAVYRAIHGRAVPDRRSCMAFLLTADR